MSTDPRVSRAGRPPLLAICWLLAPQLGRLHNNFPRSCALSRSLKLSSQVWSSVDWESNREGPTRGATVADPWKDQLDRSVLLVGDYVVWLHTGTVQQSKGPCPTRNRPFKDRKFCARRFLIRQRRMFLRLLFTIESCLMDHSSRRRSRPSSKFPVGMIGAPWHKHQLALVQCHPKETPALGIISPPPLLQTFTVHKLSA